MQHRRTRIPPCLVNRAFGIGLPQIPPVVAFLPWPSCLSLAALPGGPTSASLVALLLLLEMFGKRKRPRSRRRRDIKLAWYAGDNSTTKAPNPTEQNPAQTIAFVDGNVPSTGVEVGIRRHSNRHSKSSLKGWGAVGSSPMPHRRLDQVEPSARGRGAARGHDDKRSRKGDQAAIASAADHLRLYLQRVRASLNNSSFSHYSHYLQSVSQLLLVPVHEPKEYVPTNP